MNSGLRVALVGCGQIADAHLQQARRTRLARVVAVCDREPDLARQAAVRFGVPAEYHDFARMLRDVKPDVVHIATPPATHRELLLRSLEAGAHVYVEKPFAVTLGETEEMLAAADACGRKVCVGHDRLFDPVWLELRRRVAAGAIGEVAHVEVIQLYDLAGPFGRLVLTEPAHWIRTLPGGLFHNTLPHAFAAVSELVGDRQPAVNGLAWGRERHGVDTELQVVIRGARATATVTFLTIPGPPGSYVRIHGTSGWLEGDYEARAVRWRPAPQVPSLLVKLAVPLRQSRDSALVCGRNLLRFARGDLHYFAGLQTLLRAFYRAVIDGGPPPLPPDHVRRVAALMDEVVRVRVTAGGVPAPHGWPVLQV